MVNDVNEDDGPEEDSVKKENLIHHSNVLGNVLLVMQACFVVMASKSCARCDDLSKMLDMMSSHKEGWHVLDVYKPHRAKGQSMTVNNNSYCSNGFQYQLPCWLMTTGADLRRMLCLGRPYCNQLADLGKLTGRRLVMWTQLQVDYLKGGIRAVRICLARGIFKLASGVVNLGLWAEELSCRVDVTMSKDEVAVLER